MRDFANGIRLFSNDELDQLHHASLEILAEPGMKILAPALLAALERHGASVDLAGSVVRFPPALVEQTIAGMQQDLAEGRKPLVLNGVVMSKSSGPVQAKFGGACIETFDWDLQEFRSPTRQDLIDLVRLGEALPEVATVGNPVTYLTEEDGAPVDPRMQRVKTAALIACYTTKAGPTEAWNTTELDFLMEIGAVVRGSREAYLASPCFVTAKETISPLILEESAGSVLLVDGEGQIGDVGYPMSIPSQAHRGEEIRRVQWGETSGTGLVRLDLGPAYPACLGIVEYYRDFLIRPGRELVVRDHVLLARPRKLSWLFQADERLGLGLNGLTGHLAGPPRSRSGRPAAGGDAETCVRSDYSPLSWDSPSSFSSSRPAP